MKYTEKVMDHFTTPRNVGEIENPSGIGEVGNPVCGDVMRFYIKVSDNKIDDVKFKTFGCGAAIAVSSMISEMAMGKTVEEADKITNSDVAMELDGLPKTKMHCSNLGADALRAAIKNFRDREAGLDIEKEVIEDPHEHDHDHDEDDGHEGKSKQTAGGACKCPFCKVETDANLPFCNSCGSDLQDGCKPE